MAALQFGAAPRGESTGPPEPQDKYILSVPAWGLSIPHTPSKMSLITLDEDIFPRILSLLDIITVVRCRQVCWYMCYLAESKDVWVALVFDLCQRRLLDLPATTSDTILNTLRDMPTDELIAHVKRVVRGPDSWTPTGPAAPGPPNPPPSTIHREILIPMDDSILNEAQTMHIMPTLLLGGTHLIVHRGFVCELWDVKRAARIWKSDYALPPQIQLCFTSRDVSDEGSEEMIIALTTGAAFMREMLLEVFRLDLKTHATREMFSTPVPAGVRCACYPTIHRDFVALQVELTSDDQPPPAIDVMNKRSRVIIINWREGTYVLLDGLFSQKFLIANHVVLFADTGHGWEVYVYALSSFTSFWTPLSENTLSTTPSPVPIDTLPSILSHFVFPSQLGETTSCLELHEDVLRSGSFVASVYSTSGYHTTYERYSLTLSAAGPSTNEMRVWTKISTHNTLGPVKLDHFTYSGYGLAINYASNHVDVAVTRAYCAGDAVESSRVTVNGASVDVDIGAANRIGLAIGEGFAAAYASLAAYSSALVVCVHEGVWITYHK
ncbi:hypothetical protein B0H10DRAFT_90943 [Mycena sp. CBHHK59/15]|nr:hypothetical protein B0H10DRAFT_90943 [Mycena sp. CBHHK59/15]